MRLCSVYEIRCELMLTQAELGLVLGKHRNTIRNWELEGMKLDIDAVKSAASLQGCPLPGEPGFEFKRVRRKKT